MALCGWQERKNQKQKQAPESLLVIQVAAEWHAEWDPIQPANTMGALWCESGSWAGITDSTAHWLATGHWAPSTDWPRREWRERDDWLGALVTFRSLGTRVAVKTPTHFSARTHTHTDTHSLDTFTHLHTFRTGVLCLQTGRLLVELGQLRPPWLNLGSMEQTLYVRVCVFFVVS